MRILRWGEYPGLPGVPNVITGVLIRGRHENRVGESNVKAKAEMGVMEPQPRQCLEAGRGKEDSLRASRRSQTG